MNGHNNDPEHAPAIDERDMALHPAWRAFICYCRQMGHGEIERLKIQDGIPVLVEISRQKIKFS